ncbi:MAG TPA: competence protein ComEC, partial [Sphingomonas sp.]|nr:competence protein ComEC [Sphingomonas sp.]
MVAPALDGIERWLEAERDQLPLWLPVMLAAGIAGWFLLPDRSSWLALIAAALGLALAGLAIGPGRRAGFATQVAGLAIASGCALVWAKAEWVAAPVLTRPMIASFTADVE